jgi:uncharacterized protein YlzI (FlbEa/FlbD family)
VIELHLADGNHTPFAAAPSEVKQVRATVEGARVMLEGGFVTVTESYDEVMAAIAAAKGAA